MVGLGWTGLENGLENIRNERRIKNMADIVKEASNQIRHPEI